MRFFRRGAGAFALLGVLTFSACDRLFDKGSATAITAAEKKVAAGDFRGAVARYESALDGTVASADTHYKLALLYDEKLKSPLDALHHMDRYLELAPAGAHARDAKAYRKESESLLLARLSKGSPITQQEAVRVKNENQNLREQVAAAREQITALRAQKTAPHAGAAAKSEPVQKPIPPGSRTHTVRPGETLSMIAQKYYRNKARWKDVQDANFNSLEGTVKIKPGMTLIIP